MNSLAHSSERRRRDRRALARVVALRRANDDEASYMDTCRLLCRDHSLETNLARSVVWRHVVLGHSPLRSLPPLEDLSTNTSGASLSSVSPSSLSRSSESPPLSPTSSSGGNSGGAAVPSNCQPRVVEVDVERSLWGLYPDAEQRASMRALLKAMLLRILGNNAERHYYQGLHELMGFVMYVMEPAAPMDVIAAVCERLLLSQWRSFSDERLSQSQSMLYAMHAVVAREDAELAAALEDCGVAPESHYAVAWLITWYTHVCDDTEALARVFDFFISGDDEQTVIFFTAALLLHERERILAWIREKCDVDADELMIMARVYTQLVSLPRELITQANSAALERIMAHAKTLSSRHADCVAVARNDFLAGRVTRRGMLADTSTRNSALRLLWWRLFREWRKPWKDGGAARPLIAAVFVAVSAIVLRYFASQVEYAGS